MIAPVIHINGWPGSGKLTIAQALAHAMGGQVLDNHLMLDAAGAVFRRGTPQHAKLRAQVTELLIDAAVTLPSQTTLVVTNALAETPSDRALLAPFQKLAQRREADFIAVTLKIEKAENRKRLTDPLRKARSKLMDPVVLEQLRSCHQLMDLPGSIHLDVTNLTAQQAALDLHGKVGAQLKVKQ